MGTVKITSSIQLDTDSDDAEKQPQGKPKTELEMAEDEGMQNQHCRTITSGLFIHRYTKSQLVLAPLLILQGIGAKLFQQ